MPKLFIMYNLKDELDEGEFFKWVDDFKGPFIAGLSAVNSYTLTRVSGALGSTGGPPSPAEIPYNIVGIVDVTSFEAYAKDQETPGYKDDFMPKMLKWVKNMTIMRADEMFHRAT